MFKLDSPTHFKGQNDTEKVESWLYQIENYSVLASAYGENLKARYAMILLTKGAAMWLHTRGYDLQTLAL